MRPYRGIRIDNGEWVYGWYYNMNDSRKGDRRHIIVYESSESGNQTIHELVDPKTVGQYIGLDDVNKTEMYKDDIILVKLHRWDKPAEVIASGKAVIEFRDGCFGFEWGDGNVRDFTTFRSFTRTTFEVIGNVHQHPHLLGEGAQ